MYAMLTGNLPFTVEPFNIKSLYNKMMKNEMNPIPEHLSKSDYISNLNLISDNNHYSSVFVVNNLFINSL
jgi:hypothetical protein